MKWRRPKTSSRGQAVRSPTLTVKIPWKNDVLQIQKWFWTAACRWNSVFLWLWLGHMYIGSKGFATHIPGSPVYGETLLRFTRAVYPPKFLRIAARRWASLFFGFWLGHMYMGSKGFAMHSPRSPIYGETLARCTRIVYLPWILRTAARRWASMFLWFG
jgi:hypothetical protein